MIKLVLDKYGNRNERLFSFDDDDSSSNDNKIQNENQKKQHNIEQSDSYCKYCLAKLASFQIDFDQSIRLCTNSECSQFKNNNSNDINLFHIELVENESNKICNDQFLTKESVDLESILNNFSSIANRIIDQGLVRYQNYQLYYQQNPIINNDNFSNSIDHTQTMEFNNTENAQSADQILNQNNFDANITQPAFQPQQSVLFNDNFFSDINLLLTQEDDNNNHLITNNIENVNYINNNNPGPIDWMSFETNSTATNLDTNLFDFTDQTTHLEPLKSTNTSKLAAQLASDSLSNDFLDEILLDHNHLDEKTRELPTNSLSSCNIDEEIISNAKSRNSSSGILITRKRQVNKPDQSINVNNKKQTGPFEVAISSTKLKLADGEDLELLELMSKSNQNNDTIPKRESAIKLSLPETKPIESSPSKKLLSWEIKNKDYKRKAKTQTEQDGSNKIGTSSSSPFSSSQNKLNGISAMSRFQNSITKADLSQKSKKLEYNLKEKGAELKQALLQNHSFLSSTTTAAPGSFSLNSVTKPSGGYRDLVLSVLKKKTTT